MFKQYLRRLWHTFFPTSCMSCGGRLLGNEQYVCTSCLAQWPRPFLGDNPKDNNFVRRFWGPFPIESGATVFSYFPGSEMTKVIHSMKYGNRPDICHFMGKLMTTSPLVVQMLSEADALVPIPITDGRRHERGYNQSELLCEGISSVVEIPIYADALRRIHFAESQTSLSHTERAENIRGAFIIGNHSTLIGKHVVLVDDIVTTGSTTLECLRTLSTISDIKVSILSLAWTGGHF